MANQPPFSLAQTVFMLSLGSNYLFGKTADQPTLLKEIQAYLGTPGGSSGDFFEMLNGPNPSYQSLSAPDWKTVWGPAVYQAKDNPGATNTMFVAYSATEKCYVVAIAGTNPLGDSALFFEDLDVSPANMVAWPPTISGGTLTWTPSPNPPSSTPAIAAGTAGGLSALFGLAALGINPVNNVVTANPVTVQGYLQSVASSGATLVFTGHSLGGALSPTMALMLYPTPATVGGWGAVRILATAGPTPGTAGMAGLFSANYAPVAIPAYDLYNNGAFQSFTFWNQNYSNKYDVVPRAWDQLYGLVTQPARPLIDFWPSFFADNAALAPVAVPPDPAPGPTAFNMVANMQTRAGYQGQTTQYYAPAVPHNPFTGIFGTWSTGDAYPKSWKPTPPPKQVLLFDPDLVHWILDAHLDQYPYAFLGQTAPKFPAHK
jgi:hypothetical protein